MNWFATSVIKGSNMDFSELKQLAKKLGGILVMNGNSPEFVVLAYDQYQKLTGGVQNSEPRTNPSRLTPEEEETIEKLNKEILALKEEIRQKEEAELAQTSDSQPLPGLAEGEE